MKRGMPAHIYNKKGVLYFQRRGYPTTRIDSAPGTREFALEYAALLNGARFTPKSVSRDFDALVKDYIKSARYRNLAPRTARDYEKILLWVREKMGPLPVSGIQRKDIIRARDANAETSRFANYIVQVMRILLEHSIDIGWREDNPAKGVSLIKSTRAPRKAWPQDMIDAYRATAKGRALLIFELCLGTGQRIGDVLKMRWSDIDGDGINVSQGKTGAALWIPFTDRLRTVLSDTPRIGMTICAWGPAGKASSYRGAADLVMAVRREIGAEEYDIHGLRYAAASELSAAGCSDEMIMAITGHQTLAMVRKYSGATRQKSHAKAAQRLRGTEHAQNENVANLVEKKKGNKNEV